MDNDIITKEYVKKDVFFNNGLINLKMYLDDENINEIYSELTSNKLILKYPSNMEEKNYNKILRNLIEENNIIIRTEKDRLYWDKNNSCFIYDKKYDVIGKSSGNDVKNLYSYITPKDIGISTEELYMKYLEFTCKTKLNESNKETDTKIFKKGDDYKKENLCKIPVLMTRSEAIESYIKFIVKGNTLKLDSKIHQFEDGGFCFKDMISDENSVINKWDALVYWYGVRIKRYYNSSYFIYLNSIDLLSLYELKKYLKIADTPILIKNEKKGVIKSIPTNVNLSRQLKFDGIENENFYISNSASEFQLKFMMYICSHLFHIESLYKSEDKERIKKRKEKLFSSLNKIRFVTYTEDSNNMKSSLEEYTRVYKVINFLNKLMKVEYLDASMFKYFAQLMVAVSMSKREKEKVNLNIKTFVEKIIKFEDIRKVLYNVSFKILKKDEGALGLGLYEFQKIYLNEIKRGDYVMDLHDKSKEIGSSIGVFAANLDDKDLLFRLRNVKNHKQLISYFRDFKFTVLNKQTEAKIPKQFNEMMEQLLICMEKKPENWEIIRDYIAIYAIDKYRAAMYAKDIDKGGK